MTRSKSIELLALLNDYFHIYRIDKFAEKFLATYKTHCELDPLLECTLVQLTPDDGFQTLCECIHPLLTTAWLVGKGSIREAEV